MMRLLLCLIAAAFALPAQAEPVKKLTKANIEHFIADMAKITEQDNGMSDQDIQDYLETHLADAGLYKSIITYNIPGYPAQEQNMALVKEQFIENVVSGRHSLADYTSSVQLRKHKIARGGQSATITTLGQERGRMPFQGQDLIPFQGTSECEQELGISGSQTIEILSANCQTIFYFLIN